MLIFERKAGDEIQIGSNINITVLRVRGQTVKLGFVAPSDVTIFRSELWIEIQEDQEPAPSTISDTTTNSSWESTALPGIQTPP
ncbi:MAG: carbon storage regulator [Pirellulaceae bacterium]